MKHQIKVRFPANSDVVLKAFTDKDFHTGKLEQMDCPDYEVLGHSYDGKDFQVKISRKVPITVSMPGPVKKLLGGGELTIVHEDCWNVASKTGHVNLDIKGMPVRMACALSLVDEGDGCVYTYDWEVTAKVPLIGKLLEKTLVADLNEKIPLETEVGIALLANYQ